jgi:hypothetical protein
MRRVDADPHRAAVADQMKKVIRDYFAEQSQSAAASFVPAFEPEEVPQ